MIEACRWQNFGPLADLSWDELGPINLVIGANGCGKTFVLKSLYVAMRTLEQHGRGQEQRTAAQILAEKLYWTFQPEHIGELVAKGSQEPLSFNALIDGDPFSYSFGSSSLALTTPITILLLHCATAQKEEKTFLNLLRLVSDWRHFLAAK